MKVYIYTLPNCKACAKRVDYHEAVATTLHNNGSECILVEIGEIDGKTYLPYNNHDSLCRKAEDPGVYSTPTYIIEVGDSVAKVADPSMYPDSNAYINHLNDVASKISS